MHTVVQDQTAGAKTSRLQLCWSILGPLGLGITLISLMFLSEARSAIDVWNTSTAYSHCYLVLPMALYLLWERRELLSVSKPEPELVAAVAAVPLTLLWLIAERLGIMEARQLAVISGFELLFFTVLGRRLFGRLSGPLLFLFFLVPFGAFMTPALQQFTAKFTIIGLNLLGISNFADKFTIETPAGIFFVAEACAGLRFLIAAIAFGVFYSLMNFLSLGRRIAFIAASIIVPVIANGFRALGIVVLGQVLGSAQAAAADHVVYGWIFFSIIMLLLIAGGHAFRESSPVSIDESASHTIVLKRSPYWCVAVVVLMFGLGPALAGAVDSHLTAPVLPDVTTVATPLGCSMTKVTDGSSDRQSSTIICDKIRFEVRVSVFPARSTSSAMISERRRVTQEIGAENSTIFVMDTPADAGSWTVVQNSDPNRLTAYAGWVDGVQVTSSVAGRIAQAHDSIFGAAFLPALITITTAESSDSPAGQRKATLAQLTFLLSAQTNLNSRMMELTRARTE